MKSYYLSSKFPTSFHYQVKNLRKESKKSIQFQKNSSKAVRAIPKTQTKYSMS